MQALALGVPSNSADFWSGLCQHWNSMGLQLPLHLMQHPVHTPLELETATNQLLQGAGSDEAQLLTDYFSFLTGTQIALVNNKRTRWVGVHALYGRLCNACLQRCDAFITATSS